MISSVYVVKCIYHYVKLAHKRIAKAMLLDSSFKTLNIDGWILMLDSLAKTYRFGETNMLSSKKKLSIKITDVYGV